MPQIIQSSNNDIIAKVASSEIELQPKEIISEQCEVSEYQKASTQLLREQVTDVSHYRELRNTYAFRVFIFMCCWSSAVFLILMLKGFFPHCFLISDMVMTTLVGGTTISVVGLVGFMMQGLFHSNK